VTAPEYTAIRHARVADDSHVLWLAIGRWDYADGTTEWTLEYWDAQGEAGDDTTVADEETARALAAQKFGIEEEDWRDGPQPWGA